MTVDYFYCIVATLRCVLVVVVYDFPDRYVFFHEVYLNLNIF